MSAGRAMVLLIGVVMLAFAGIAAIDRRVEAQTDPTDATTDFAEIFGVAYGDMGSVLPLLIIVVAAIVALAVFGRAK